jgi:hypothetical protein
MNLLTHTTTSSSFFIWALNSFPLNLIKGITHHCFYRNLKQKLRQSISTGSNGDNRQTLQLTVAIRALREMSFFKGIPVISY